MIQRVAWGKRPRFESCYDLLCDFGPVPLPLWAMSSSAKYGMPLLRTRCTSSPLQECRR